MANLEQTASLLGKIAGYIEILSKDPHSTAFVSLAEAYRQMGLLDDALEVVEKGVAALPKFSLGLHLPGADSGATGRSESGLRGLLPRPGNGSGQCADAQGAGPCLRDAGAERAVSGASRTSLADPTGRCRGGEDARHPRACSVSEIRSSFRKEAYPGTKVMPTPPRRRMPKRRLRPPPSPRFMSSRDCWARHGRSTAVCCKPIPAMPALRSGIGSSIGK